MQTTNSASRTPASRPALQHFLADEVPHSGIVHVNFRVGIHDVPRWLPEHKSSGGARVEGYTGEQILFEYKKYDKNTGEEYLFTGDLHSVAVDCESFWSCKIANAYWTRVDTQKGPKAVITFWLNKHSGQDSELRLLNLFDELCGETWDYMELYVNPENKDANRAANLSLVFKGGSKKPVQHRVSIGKAEATEALDSQGRTLSEALRDNDQVRGEVFPHP